MKTLEQKKPIEVEVERYTEDDYNAMLNEGGDVNVCGYSFEPADVLRECDPIAYRCGFNDYQEYDTKYECPLCGEQFGDEDDCIECCGIDRVYECEYCREKYSDEDECEECETNCAGEEL